MFASECPELTPPLFSARPTGGLIIRLEVTCCYTLWLLLTAQALTSQLSLGRVNNRESDNHKYRRRSVLQVVRRVIRCLPVRSDLKDS